MKGPDWDLLEHLGKRRKMSLGLQFSICFFLVAVVALIVAVWQQ